MPRIEIEGPGGKKEIWGNYDSGSRTVTSSGGSRKVHLSEQDRVTENPCFIATAAYGDQDIASLGLLRAFRDSILSQTALGRLFIRFYYRVAPLPARFVARSPSSRRFVRGGLDLVIRFIERTTSLRRSEPSRYGMPPRGGSE